MDPKKPNTGVNFLHLKNNEEDEILSFQEAAVHLMKSKTETGAYLYDTRLANFLKDKIHSQLSQTQEQDQILYKKQIEEGDGAIDSKIT